VLMVLGLGVACGGGGDDGGDGGNAAASDNPKGGFHVEAKDYAFVPAELSTKAGAGSFTIELKNTGAVEHDLSMDEPKFKVTALAGQTKSATVKLEPGTYDIYCSVAGHRGQGMEGKLTVE
jgi:plastocyanin